LVYLGEAVAAAGNWPAARRTFLDALHLAQQGQATSLAMDALVGLAELAAQAGQAGQAAELCMRVSSHPASTQAAKDRAAHLRAQLESQLAPQQIEAVQTRAQVQSLDALVAELLAAELEEDKALLPELSSK
jgi:hypothetical protein